MQKKKDYTHEQIVEIAKREFLKNGYAKTSMRDIAKGAGIGVSNIYNYFKSKDELFRHIVMPLLHQMETMMREHHNVKNQEAFLIYATGECNEMIADHVQEYMRLINNHRDELKLLLYQSQGSSLENHIDTIYKRSILLAYPVLPLGILVWLMKLWTAAEWYYQGAAEEIGADYAEGLKTLSSLWALFLVIILVLAAGSLAISIVSRFNKCNK